MTDLELFLIGKGPFARVKHVPCKAPYRGEPKPAVPVFNAEQAAENRKLYPHLFRD